MNWLTSFYTARVLSLGFEFNYGICNRFFADVYYTARALANVLALKHSFTIAYWVNLNMRIALSYYIDREASVSCVVMWLTCYYMKQGNIDIVSDDAILRNLFT